MFSSGNFFWRNSRRVLWSLGLPATKGSSFSGIMTSLTFQNTFLRRVTITHFYDKWTVCGFWQLIWQFVSSWNNWLAKTRQNFADSELPDELSSSADGNERYSSDFRLRSVTSAVQPTSLPEPSSLSCRDPRNRWGLVCLNIRQGTLPSQRTSKLRWFWMNFAPQELSKIQTI